MNALDSKPRETNDPHGSGGRVCAEGSLEMGLAGDGWLRYGIADLGDVVEEARERLDLSPVATAALGRAMAASTLLLRLSLKTPSRLVLEVRGDGPLRSVLAETDAEGNLRGTVGAFRVQLPQRPDRKLPVGAAVGAGTLRVVREHPKGTYASKVELVSGEIGLDVAHYLQQSEQTSSAVLLGVLTRPDGVTGAGGLIVEALPGAPEEVVRALEDNLSALGGVSRMLEEGGSEQVLDGAFAGLDREVLERRTLRHRCRCDRERLRLHLAALSDEERDSLRTERGVIEGDCVFCGVQYVFAPEELAAGAGSEARTH
jgi:molecular chaperone Hsp33